MIEETARATRRAEVMLLLTTLIWGATFAITKYLVDAGTAPMAVVAWRFAIATVIFLVAFGRRIASSATRTTLVNGAVLGIFLWAGFGLQALGLGITTSSRSGFITAFYVIFTPLLQIAVTRRAPSRNVVIGIVLVLLGLWGLTAPGGEVGGLIDPWRTGGFNFGDLLTLISAFFFAIYIVLLDRYSTGGDVVTLTAVQLAVVAVVSVAYVAVEELGRSAPAWTIEPSVPSLAAIFYLAFFASVIATYWQTLYQRETTPSRAAVIFTFESVFAAVIGALALGDELTPLSFSGGALIVLGLLVVELKRGAGNDRA